MVPIGFDRMEETVFELDDLVEPYINFGRLFHKEQGMLTAYPTEFPREAIELAIDFLRGKSVDKSKAFLAGWNLLGFALGKMDGVPFVVGGGENPEEFDASTLQGFLDVEDGKVFGAFPWALLIPIALKIIEKLIERRKS